MIKKIGNLYSFKRSVLALGAGRALLVYTDKYEKGWGSFSINYGTFTDLLSSFRNAIHSWDELREAVVPPEAERIRIIKNIFRLFR